MIGGLTVDAALDAAAHDLARALDAPIDEARRDAQSLFCHALARNRAWIAAHRDDALSTADAALYLALVERRAAGEPVAYIVGVREFWGAGFEVGPAVLIPRPDTETLVEAALAGLAADRAAAVLDLGTGSGAIAVSIARERPAARVTAVDRSAHALIVARRNARRLGATVEFVRSDWYAALGTRRFDLIVSNPPYIADGDAHLGQGDLRFEPRAALAAGADGLADIRRIVAGAVAHLNPGGRLLFEHGWDQADACATLLAAAGFGALERHRDLAGIARVAGGRLLTADEPRRYDQS